MHRHAAALVTVSAGMLIVIILLEFFYFRRLSGGLASLDMRVFGFTPDEGMAWLTALGRRGSEIVIVWHYLTFALVFPALFSLTLIALFLSAGQRLPRFAALSNSVRVGFALALVLPFTLADYVQNFAVVRLLSDFLSANPDSLGLASALIVTKFALGLIPLAVIVAFYLAGERHKRAGLPGNEDEQGRSQ
ncbi:hypothetical protein BFN67_03240 [Pseudaminobacter manganicus]|uniref:Uncharacterized protein n=2 Tax=Manganibacter manganicus TaxID=1873176 RepID=A0A1V8RS07_9HYPH|nr:hypothetical protein BFN67_03240 [Pseudaminobacter manganicus]